MNGSRPTGKVRIVERAGPTVADLIANRSPWTSSPCGRPKCAPCKTKEGSCRAHNLVYKITCTECANSGTKSLYIGESHRSWWDRSGDHITALRTKNPNYAIVKHWQTNHPQMETPPNFKFEVVERCHSSLERQIKEAIHIRNEECDVLMNGRGEWGLNIIPQLTPTIEGKIVEYREPANHPKRKEFPDRAAEGQTEFETQYAQRRKRQRLTKQLESQGRHIPEPGQSKEWPPESSSTGNLRAMKEQPRLFCIGRSTNRSEMQS